MNDMSDNTFFLTLTLMAV